MCKHYTNIIIHHTIRASPYSFYSPPFLLLISKHVFFRISWPFFFPSFLMPHYRYIIPGTSLYSPLQHLPSSLPTPIPPLSTSHSSSVKFSPSHSLSPYSSLFTRPPLTRSLFTPSVTLSLNIRSSLSPRCSPSFPPSISFHVPSLSITLPSLLLFLLHHSLT